MAKGKRKPIHYARATVTPKLKNGNLQQLVDDAFSNLKTLQARSHIFKDGMTLQARHFNKRSRSYGSQFHIVSYTTDEPTTIVPKAKPRQVDADLDEAKPPRNADYMDGETFLLVKDNHVLICASGVGVGDTKIARFFQELIVASGASASTVAIKLNRVADVNKLKLIQKHGVKALALNASMDEAGLRNAARTSARRSIIGGAMDQVNALIFKDESDADDEARANLDTEIIIKLDRWGRGKLSQEKLTELTELALEEDVDGVRVILTNDTVISGSRIATHKYFEIAQKAKGLFRADALGKIDKYAAELKSDGYLD